MIDNGLRVSVPALRFWRLDRQLTQAQLARKASVHANTVMRLETGQTAQAHLSTAKRLARTLGVTLEELTSQPQRSGSPTQAA